MLAACLDACNHVHCIYLWRRQHLTFCPSSSRASSLEEDGWIQLVPWWFCRHRRSSCHASSGQLHLTPPASAQHIRHVSPQVFRCAHSLCWSRCWSNVTGWRSDVALVCVAAPGHVHILSAYSSQHTETFASIGILAGMANVYLRQAGALSVSNWPRVLPSTGGAPKPLLIQFKGTQCCLVGSASSSSRSCKCGLGT